MYKATAVRTMLLTASLDPRLLVAGLVGIVLISGYPTARAESTRDQLTPAEIQKKVRVGDAVIIGTKDWFLIGNEKYRTFTLQVTQVTSTGVVGMRVDPSAGVSRDEGEVTVPFEQIDTIKDPNKASFRAKLKCSLRALPYAVVNPYTASASASDRCANILYPPPQAGGLP